MFCEKCGSNVSDQAQVCPKCGNKLTMGRSRAEQNQINNTRWLMEHMYAFKITVAVAFVFSLIGLYVPFYGASASAFGVTVSASGSIWDYFTQEINMGIVAYGALICLIAALALGVLGMYLLSFLLSAVQMVPVAWVALNVFSSQTVQLKLVGPILCVLGFACFFTAFVEYNKVKKYKQSMGM